MEIVSGCVSGWSVTVALLWSWCRICILSYEKEEWISVNQQWEHDPERERERTT